MSSIAKIDPFRCRMWEFHDRLESNINEQSCRAEIANFKTYGQLVPVLGRPTKGNADYDVELIYGARRLFVARHLKTPIVVDITEVSDREAFIAMDSENRLRKDLSPYERALSYAHWLRNGHFRSQDELARALNISAAQVSRILKLTQLPSVLIQAFDNPTDIREEWGVRLVTLIRDTRSREAIIGVARSLLVRANRTPSINVYQRLVAAAAVGRKLKQMRHDVPVRGPSGSTIFRIRHRRHDIAVLLPIDKVPENTLTRITEAIMEIMHSSGKRVED